MAALGQAQRTRPTQCIERRIGPFGRRISLNVQPRSAILVVLLLLTVLTAAVYYPVRSYPFINYDDPDYVSANPHVLEGLTWESVEWAFTTGYSANWHPVTWLSHVLDCQFYGIDAGWHHVTSLALHNCECVFAVSLVSACNRHSEAQCCGSSYICASPDKRRVCGLDSRA